MEPATDLYLNKSIDPTVRDDIYPGLYVAVVLKKDQPTGQLTFGFVQNILTPKAHHPRGIKVRLTDGSIGRVRGAYTQLNSKIKKLKNI